MKCAGVRSFPWNLTEIVRSNHETMPYKAAIQYPSRAAARLLAMLLLGLCGLAAPGLRAQAAPLLAKAVQKWDIGQGDLAFTQETRYFSADGQVKEERMERYDPSLPDSQRWRLTEVNGQPATDEERRRWETHKNSKPRKKVDSSPSEFLDLDHAALIGETPRSARFRVPLRPKAQRLLSVDNIDVVITVDKLSESVSGVGAALRAPMRVLLGVARITDLDVDLRLIPADEGVPDAPDEVQPSSTARVMISKLGRPMEYNWSDFKRVASYPRP
jgi:hypothetical protein